MVPQQQQIAADRNVYHRNVANIGLGKGLRTADTNKERSPEVL